MSGKQCGVMSVLWWCAYLTRCGPGLTGAMGQIFIFVTIGKFGALTCALIGLARKITTLVVSILFFGHQ